MHHTVVAVVLDDARQALVPFAGAHFCYECTPRDAPVAKAMEPVSKLLHGRHIYEVDEGIAKRFPLPEAQRDVQEVKVSRKSFFAKEVEQSGTCEALWQVPQHDSGLREEILRVMGPLH